MASTNEIKAVVSMLMEAFGRKPSAATYLAYEAGLAGVDDAAARAATVKALQEVREHPPGPGELRAMCLGKSTGELEARAHAAFKLADQLARSQGVAAHPSSLNDPILTHALGSVGGWGLFCSSVNEWQERNFIAAYVDAAANPQLEAVAQISQNGEPIGALRQARKQLANTLAPKEAE